MSLDSLHIKCEKTLGSEVTRVQPKKQTKGRSLTREVGKKKGWWANASQREAENIVWLRENGQSVLQFTKHHCSNVYISYVGLSTLTVVPLRCMSIHRPTKIRPYSELCSVDIEKGKYSDKGRCCEL